MNYIKIIFLLGMWISSAYSMGWDRFHPTLIQMSWRTHWFEELSKMEDEETTKEKNTEFLRNFLGGAGKKVRTQTGMDLQSKGYLDFNHFVRQSQSSPYIGHEVNMGEILASGLIPLSFHYKHNARDRRWTAGWLFDLIDIVRQQGFTKLLFEGSHDDIFNNDLLKVRELSGTFWKWNGNIREINSAKELCSGIIQPSQKIEKNTDISKVTVNIISSFQALWNKYLDEVYFLPKGAEPTADNFFKVINVKVGNGDFLNQAGVTTLSHQWNEDDFGGLFQENDFALIKVRNSAVTGENTLRQLLHDKSLLSGNRVIPLMGDFEDGFAPNRIFAFGKPNANLNISTLDPDGFCLVSDVFNGNAAEDAGDRLENNTPTLLVQPLRKLKNSADIYSTTARTETVTPRTIPLAVSVQSISIPLSPGMNGGPALMCQMKGNSPPQIKCRLIGVVRGSALTKEADNKISYKGLVSLAPHILNDPYEKWKDVHSRLVQGSSEAQWADALERMERPAGDHTELTEGQQLIVLERFAKGRGKVSSLNLIADLQQPTTPYVGHQIAPDLSEAGFLDNKMFPADADMRKVLELGMLKIPYRDRRLAAGIIFSSMDIARQQPVTYSLFNVARDAIHKNDLLKVKKLSGTFWKWDRTKSIHFAAEQFSGMIQTEQNAKGDTIDVLSCVHGIEDSNLSEIYFLPKGKSKTQANLFQVKSFQVGNDRAPRLESTAGIDSSQDDYAIMQVSNIAVDGKNTLDSILSTEGMLTGDNVTSLRGDTEVFDPDRVFAFGKPGASSLKKASADANGFCLVSDVFDGNIAEHLENNRNVAKLKVSLLRKLKNANEKFQVEPEPETVFRRPTTKPLEKSVQALPLSSSPGMSGGPVLACKVDDESSDPTITCKHFAVVRGSTLIQNDQGKTIHMGLIATPKT